jgi:hypothetical protein
MVMRLFAAMLSVSAVILASATVHADTYTWVDSKGALNVSNLPPADSARVSKLTHQAPPPVTPRSAASIAAARQAEVQALTDRVRQLEQEVELAKASPPPEPIYRPIPIPAQPPYAPSHSPPAPRYVTAPPADDGAGCDPTWSWSSCLGSFPLGTTPFIGSPAFYPPTVVVVRAPGVGRFQRFNYFGPSHPSTPQRPTRPPGGIQRR